MSIYDTDEDSIQNGTTDHVYIVFNSLVEKIDNQYQSPFDDLEIPIFVAAKYLRNNKAFVVLNVREEIHYKTIYTSSQVVTDATNAMDYRNYYDFINPLG